MTAPQPPRRGTRLLVQVLLFCIGLALLAWCIRTALKPENAEHIERLRNAPADLLVSIIALSLTTLFLNAVTFWTAIYPVKRVPFWDIQATNAGAALSNYAPAKLGALLRFIVHNRRNHVPIFTIGAWIGAVSVTMMCALIPVVAAGMWRKAFDAWFLLALFGGLAFTYTTTLLLARAFAGERGLVRLRAISARFRSKLLTRFMHSRAFQNLHAGMTMLAHPWAFGAGVLLRVADLLVQALRFMVAARLLGLELGFEGALIVSGAYFLVSVFSPAGSLGIREWITSQLALFGITQDTMTVMALTVTLSEMAVYVVCGSAGLLYLRPDRFLVRGDAGAQAKEPIAQAIESDHASDRA
ncbi:MAG TPA: lysylphosphatidylglycerol synthase domain-containing protein [Phycisphaerales bacterium]|nr:lysylphosphatidylglycerol synthase domain-containing protein [Phycisphaerales bacterium]